MSLGVPIQSVAMAHYDCPCCGSVDSETIHTDPLYGLTIDVCKICGSIYRARNMDGESWRRWARRSHRSAPNVGYHQRAMIQSYTVNKLIEVDPGDRVLWIDAPIVMHESILRDTHVTACQQSESHYLYNRQIYPAIDHRNTISIQDGNYDVVICLDYLHYVPNPGQYLRHLRDRMSDGGMLLLSVPVIDRPTGDALRNGLYDGFSSFYTTATIDNLISSSGFDVKEYYGQYAAPTWLLVAGDPQPVRVIDGTLDAFSLFRRSIDLVLAGDFESLRRENPLAIDGYFRFRFGTPDEFDHAAIQREISDVQRVFGDYIPAIGHTAHYAVACQDYVQAKKLLSYITTYACDHSLASTLAQVYYDLKVFDEAVWWFSMAIKMLPPQEDYFARLVASAYAMREFVDE